MFVLSESYVQNLEYKAITEELTFNLAPNTYRQYGNDTHTWFIFKKQSPEFKKIFNKHDIQIQFKIED